jgi:DNA polymerase III subunit epsilon
MDYLKPWREYPYVAFDTETTGKFPLVAEIVEIAAAKWIGGKVVETYQTFVKPNRLMGETVINIHHITNEMVADAPKIKEVLPAFHSFIQDSVLMAHHAPFDMGFMAIEFEALGLPLPESPVLDSCVLGRKAFPKSINHRLATLVSLLNIKMDQAHRALDDSLACQEVAIKCMEQLGQDGTLDFMFKAQGGAMLWPRYSMSDLLKVEMTKTLVEACRGQMVLEIVYQGGTKPGVPRRMTPQGLVRNPEGDYVVGLCHNENTEKRFFINRILSSKILD